MWKGCIATDQGNTKTSGLIPEEKIIVNHS